VLGALAGFLFGLSLDLVLLTFAVVGLESAILTIAPFAFLILGIVLGLTAPFGRAPATATATA
jgi:hypothetical protein